MVHRGVDCVVHRVEHGVDIDALSRLLTALVPGVDAVKDARELPRVEGAVVRKVGQIGAGPHRVPRRHQRTTWDS